MLEKGYRLRSHDGETVTVEAVYDSSEEETVYNCRVAEYHTYFVGREEWGFSVWAHNQYVADANEVQAVKDALNQNHLNAGVGIVHLPTGKIHIKPFNDSALQGGGHIGLVDSLSLNAAECRGFGVAKNAAGNFEAANVSHLNGIQGQPGSLQMPANIFNDVVDALKAAGL